MSTLYCACKDSNVQNGILRKIPFHHKNIFTFKQKLSMFCAPYQNYQHFFSFGKNDVIILKQIV